MIISELDRRLLKHNDALRIGDTVYLGCRDITDWETLPPNATTADRCNRAWMLRKYWNYGDSKGPSFHFWAQYVHDDGDIDSDEWDEETERSHQEKLAVMRKLELSERANKGRRRWRDRSATKPQRNARRRWRKLRGCVRARAIAAYWRESVTVVL